MSEVEKKVEPEADKPTESMEEKKEKTKREKAEKKAKEAAEAKARLIPPGKQKAVHRPELKPEPKAKPGGEAQAGLGDELEKGQEGETDATEGGATAEGIEKDAEQETAPEPPPKMPLPRKLFYGLATIIFGVSIVLYDHRLFTIPDVLWFVPFLLVVLGLMRVWKMGLFDRRGQTMLLGGIVLHFAMLVFIEGHNKIVPRIIVPVLIVWAGILVFIRGFQAWWKNLHPEEPAEPVEEPRKERKLWTFADMNELLVEIGELPKPDPTVDSGPAAEAAQEPETQEGQEDKEG
jgi:hypothetical protein